MSKQLIAATTTTAALMLAACGGGGGGGGVFIGGGGGGTNLNGIGGIWTGTVSYAAPGNRSSNLYGIVADNGVAKFWNPRSLATAASVGVEIAPGTINPSGSSFSARFDAYANGNVFFPNGTQQETGTSPQGITGTVSGSTITGSLSSNDNPGQDTATYSITVDATHYNLGSALSTLDGVYNFQAYFGGAIQNGQLTFSSGAITGVEAGTGCIYSGTASIIDSKYNAYGIVVNRNCSGTITSLSGLGSYFPATGSTNNLIDMIVDDGGALGIAAEILASQ